jgi:SAM-dependent methyltransferase
MPPDDSNSLVCRGTGIAIEAEADHVDPLIKGVPGYLRDVYRWAYLEPFALTVFDHQAMVSAILWGNYHRLARSVLEELHQGQRALQLASVYGPFSLQLLEALGPDGQLDVVEIAPVQIARCRRLLGDRPNVRVIQGDAAYPPEGAYDAVISFFLLHEVPEDYKTRIVDAALARVAPGGRVIFIDYHGPARLHPLRPIMAAVFALLEPFARILWTREIESYASESRGFRWHKRTFFGGLYQKVVAERIG